MEKYTKVDMPFSKRLENFWFYNKYKVLIIGFFAVATIYSLIILLTSPKPDYTILLSAKLPSSSRPVEDFRRELESYGEDQNGDGKVTVEIVDCCVAEGMDISTPSVQFVSQLKIDEIVIYMLDDTKLEYVRDYYEDEGDSAFVSAFDGKDIISCKDSDFGKKFNNSYGELYFLIRNPENANIKSDDIDQTVSSSINFVKNVAQSNKQK